MTGEARRPDEAVRQIAKAGYDGVEGIPGDLARGEYLEMLHDHQLALIANIYPRTARELREMARAVAEYAPLKIIAQSGYDCMTREEGLAYFAHALTVEQEIGITIAHETHRGRLLFTPWDAAFYVAHFPTLHIAADFSHWVAVCERLPDDQLAAVDLVCQHAVHIHGRVGYEEGPQVPDPAAPEYRRHLEWHEAQWDKIRNARIAAGDALMTFTPEYGPPSYLHTLPYTSVPVADLWRICLWAAERIRNRWDAIPSIGADRPD